MAKKSLKEIIAEAKEKVAKKAVKKKETKKPAKSKRTNKLANKKKAIKKKKTKKAIKKVAEAKKNGRPTDYSAEFCDQVFKLCLLGAKDKEIAEFFNVNVDTLYEWKKKYPKFSESIKAGKVDADIDIAHSLYKKAKGMVIRSSKAVKYKTGKDTEDVKVVTLGEELPPDFQSISLWLRNRHGDKWQDKISNINLNGTPEDPEFIDRFFGMGEKKDGK